jgi:hypothetical protein
MLRLAWVDRLVVPAVSWPFWIYAAVVEFIAAARLQLNRWPARHFPVEGSRARAKNEFCFSLGGLG